MFRMVLLRHILAPVICRYPQQTHHYLRLFFNVLQNYKLLWMSGCVPHDVGTKDLSQTGDRHFINVTVKGHTLEVKDQKGKGVLVGRRKLSEDF